MAYSKTKLKSSGDKGSPFAYTVFTIHLIFKHPVALLHVQCHLHRHSATY
jgi:hypothetical protein